MLNSAEDGIKKFLYKYAQLKKSPSIVPITPFSCHENSKEKGFLKV
jgi:hypothetical protein